jgi:hypothetical protein
MAALDAADAMEDATDASAAGGRKPLSSISRMEFLVDLVRTQRAAAAAPRRRRRGAVRDADARVFGPWRQRLTKGAARTRGGGAHASALTRPRAPPCASAPRSCSSCATAARDT